MQAVVISRTGGPEVLELEEVPRPDPADGEVLIRVRAVGINPIEWKFRRGVIPRELPAVLGSDVSGVIARSLAPGFAEGDEVFGFAASGGYAQYAAAGASSIAMRPAALSDEQAAALPVAGLTAWQALFDRGELRRGQSVLVAGAAGGVGHLAVQFAKVAGADVIGTGSGRNRDFVLGLGADVYLDYASEDPAQLQRQVDVVFDTVGGAASASLLGALSDGGVFVSIAGEPPAATEERDVRWEKLIMSRDAEQLAEIARLVAGGEVRVEIAEVMALGDVRRAHELSEAGHTRGKIVLSVGE